MGIRSLFKSKFSSSGAAGKNEGEVAAATAVSFPDGVKVWHDNPNARVDICFVHGLTGNRDSTWTTSGQTEPWPNALLPASLEDARILTFGNPPRQHAVPGT
jgi:hypothetical protein